MMTDINSNVLVSQLLKNKPKKMHDEIMLLSRIILMND